MIQRIRIGDKHGLIEILPLGGFEYRGCRRTGRVAARDAPITDLSTQIIPAIRGHKQ